MKPKTMIVAGVMSGTSADGIDVALARIAPGETTPRITVLGHRSFAYPRAVRAAVLAAQDAGATTTADLARLNWRLGALYADAVAHTIDELKQKPALVGLHGQTLYHQATAARYHGAPVRATWQTGEPALLRERLGIPVVSDFRPADLAAGGQAAPLVPMLDLCLFRSPTASRVLLNLGGIANLTALPAACTPTQVLAVDIGPANMVLDALTQEDFGKPYDRNGALAARGHILPGVVERLLGDPWFTRTPPRSCGREQFGPAYVAHFRTLCGKASALDRIATATELTAASILNAYTQFVWPHLGRLAPLARRTQLHVAGGGAHNRTLSARLTQGFAALGVTPLPSPALDPQAKEAVAFALLAWLSYNRLPGNLPSATGAAGPRILGRVTC